MTRSDLKKLIREVIEESFGNWDVEEYEVKMNGKVYSVDASFAWHEDAVDHRHDPRTDIGQDYIAEVPYKVENIQAFEINQDSHTQIDDPVMLKQLGDIALSDFLDTEESRRNGYWKR